MKSDQIIKMLRAIANAQSSLKQELLTEMKNGFNQVNKRIDKLELKVIKNGKRIDKLGKSLAYLEDDAPTREEHDKLEKRVTKIEHQVT